MTFRILALLTLVICGLLVWFDLDRANLPDESPPLQPTGVQGALPVAESVFAPQLENAKAEMRRRYSVASLYRNWGRGFRWIALLVSATVTLIAGFYGKKVEPGSQPSQEDIIENQNTSARLARVIGLLIAGSTVLAVFSQQLDSESMQAAAAADKLNEEIISATETLYNPATTTPLAQVVLIRLEHAVERKW